MTTTPTVPGSLPQFGTTGRTPEPVAASAIRPSTVLGAIVSPKTWRATVFVVLDFWVGLFVWIFMVVGLSITFGLLVTVVFAVPPLLVTMLGTRVIGIEERARFHAVLGVHIANPHRPTTGTAWQRFKGFVFSASTWKEVAYALVLFPLASIGFAFVLAAWCGSLALLFLPAYIHAFPDQTAHFGVFDVSSGVAAWVIAFIGLIGLLFVAPWCARGWAALDVLIARGLLGRPVEAELEELEERVDTLEASRTWAVEIAEAERRRIERDLHDGAQQRLVALAMDLGMAREKLDSDPEAAKALVEEAHDEAKRAIAELRDLARGIHPVALGDRGLPGAIPAIANRSPIPADVTVSVPDRPSPSIEGMAYFIISECVTNATKHSAATRLRIDVQQTPRSWQGGGRLHIEVADDGIGGAHAIDGSGSGLRGLLERVASVDGTLTISSPAGGPTIVRAELPC